MTQLILSKGQIIRNYNEIANMLGVEPTKGKGRDYHIKELERYCTYHKAGQKYIIDDVFEKPKDKVDKRSKGNNNKYGTLLDIILINSLQDNCQIEVSRTQLLKEYLHIFTDSYYSMCINQDEFIDKYNLHKFTTQKYLNEAYSIVTECIKTTLRRLSKQGIIEYSEQTLIKDNPEEFYASEDELKLIKDISARVYTEMEISPYRRSVPEINERFKKKVCNYFNEETNKQIYNFWKIYNIELIKDTVLEETNVELLRLKIADTINIKIKSMKHVNKETGEIYYPYRADKFKECFQKLDKLVFGIDELDNLGIDLDDEEQGQGELPF